MKLSRKDWLKIASPLILIAGVLLVNFFAKQKHRAATEVFKAKMVKGIIDSVFLDETNEHQVTARIRTDKGSAVFPIGDFIGLPHITSVISLGDTLYKPAGKMELWILGTSGDKSKYNMADEK